MDRRTVSAAILVAATAPSCVFAQPARLPRVAVLLSGTPKSDATRVDAFRRGLNDLGYVPAQNITISYTYANGNPQQLPSLAAEIVATRPEVVVAAGSTAASAVRAADRAIPVVMAFSSDPIAAGLVETLAHPGGNTTGLSRGCVKTSARSKFGGPSTLGEATIVDPGPF